MSDERRATQEERDRKPGVPPHQPGGFDYADGERKADEGSEESFPASDPPAPGAPTTTSGQGP
jgi:hypothetical protein